MIAPTMCNMKGSNLSRNYLSGPSGVVIGRRGRVDVYMAGASAKTTYFSAYFTYLKGVYLNAILILKFLFIID